MFYLVPIQDNYLDINEKIFLLLRYDILTKYSTKQ